MFKLERVSQAYDEAGCSDLTICLSRSWQDARVQTCAPWIDSGPLRGVNKGGLLKFLGPN